MSGNAESLSRKISSANDLESVVRSMKALAASSIRQYENAVRALETYVRTVEDGLSLCLRESRQALQAHPVRHSRGGPIGVVLFGSDQGLVGRFNETIVEFCMGDLGSLPKGGSIAWVVGERARALVDDAKVGSVSAFGAPNSVAGISTMVDRLLVTVETAFARDEVSEVRVYHNRPRGAAGYNPVMSRLLPLDEAWQLNLSSRPWPSRALPEILGNSPRTLRAFIHEYLFVVLFQACAESLASESASRLAAMERAEKNISDLLEDLRRTFHRMRQESIDEELFDVISGYEALNPRR